MDDFDQTQAIALDDFEEDEATDDLAPDGEKNPSAHLKVLFQKGLQETKHPLYEGDNIIGRQESSCHAYIPSKALSKEHACIQIIGDSHMIFDKGSRNKTRRGKLYLSPDVRYELKHKDEITFGDVKCVYEIAKEIDTIAESGSETDGSESLLLRHEVTEENSSGHLGNGTDLDNHLKPQSKESSSSSVMVKDTPEATKTSSKHPVKAPPQTLVFSESESEDEDLQTSKKKKSVVQETLLCADSDQESSHDHEAFTAATQAYVAGDQDDDTDEESSRADIISAATQAYVGVDGDDDSDTDEGNNENDVLRNEPTQAFVQPQKSPKAGNGILKSSQKSSSQLAGTQSFDTSVGNSEGGTQCFEEGEGKTNPQNDSADSATRPTQVFDEDEDEDEKEEVNEDVAGLFAMSTMACDFDDVPAEDDEEEADAAVASAEDPTQMFDLDGPTQKVEPKQDENANSETVVIEGDATLAVPETVSKKTNRGSPQKKETSREAQTVAADETLPVDPGKDTEENNDDPTQVFDETVPVDACKTDSKKDKAPPVRRGRRGKVNFDTTVGEEGTLPVSELPNRPRRGRGKATQQATLNTTAEDRVAGGDEPTQLYDTASDDPTQKVSGDDPTQVFGGDDPTQKFGADEPTQKVSGDDPTQKFGGGDDPTQNYGGISDEPTQMYGEEPARAAKNTKKSGTRRQRQSRKDLSDDEDDDEKPWMRKDKHNEPTQAYAVVDDDDAGATQLYGDNDGDDVKAASDEPTQAYGLGDEDATQAYDDNEDVDDNNGMQEEDEGATQPFGAEDPTQKYEMVTEDDDENNKHSGRTEGKTRESAEPPCASSDDDSDLEEESVLRTGAGLSDDPTQLFGAADVTEDASNDQGCEPTLAYDMAVEKESSRQKKGRLAKTTQKNEASNSTKEISPEIPNQTEEVKMSKREAAGGVSGKDGDTKADSLSDTEEMVPDSLAVSDDEVRPPMIKLPSRSPHRPALANRGRSPSPARKRVAFAEPDETNKGTEPSEAEGKRQLRTSSPAKTGKTADAQSPSPRGKRAVQRQTQPESESSPTAASGAQSKKKLEVTDQEVKEEPVTELTDKEEQKSDTSESQVEGNKRRPRGKMSDEAIAQSPAVSSKTATRKCATSDVTESTSSGTASSEKTNTQPSRARGRKGKADQTSTAEIISEDPLSKPSESEVTSTTVKSEDSGKEKASGGKSRAKRGASRQPATSAELGPSPSKKLKEKQDNGDETDETASIASSVNDVEEGAKAESAASGRGKRLTRDGLMKGASQKVEKDEEDSATPRVSSRGRRISTNKNLKDFETAPEKGKHGRSASATKKENAPVKDGSESDASSVSGAKRGKGGKVKQSSETVKQEEAHDQEMDISSVEPRSGRGRSRQKPANNGDAQKQATDSKQSSELKTEDDGDASHEEIKDQGKASTQRPVRGTRKRGRKSSVSSETSEQTEKVSADESQALAEPQKNTSSTSQESQPTGKRKGRPRASANTQAESQNSTNTQSSDIAPSSGRRGRSRTPLDKSETQSTSAEKSEMSDSQAFATPPVKKSQQTKASSSATQKRGRKSAVLTSQTQDDTSSVPDNTQSSAQSQNDTEAESASQGSSQTSARKRGAKTQSEVSSPLKKPKVSASPRTPSRKLETVAEAGHSPALRKSTMDHKPKVMFTGLIDEQGEKIVKDLGGELASSIHDCTHLVTDKVRRTVKFLSGLAKGIYIVSPGWLESCKQAGTFLDGHKFLVSDQAMEKQYKFSLSTSVTKAASNPLLSGYRVHVSKSVRPDPVQMQDILKCAGAEYLKTMPHKAQENTVVISCEDDLKLCQPAVKAGIPVVGVEFILTGILKQEVDLQSFSLVAEENSSQTAGKSRSRKK